MHYKNGRIAHAGDPVVYRDYNQTIKTGILLDTVPSSTCCNGIVSRPCGLMPESVDTKQLYHVEDALNALETALASQDIAVNKG